jgi:hypothetical protein
MNRIVPAVKLTDHLMFRQRLAAWLMATDAALLVYVLHLLGR